MLGSLAKGADVNFDILGPIDIRDADGREIRLPAGRERSLLVLLLIHRGEVVSIDQIVEALWGGHPPGTAGKAVQGYVSHLRRTLDPTRDTSGPGGLLLTRAPGYTLRVDDGSVDAARFEGLVGEGRRALEDGAVVEAAAMLDEALRLWRGPALAEFAFDDFAQAEIRHLEDLRLDAIEDRAEVSLRLGRNAEVIAELDGLVAEHPLRERLRAKLMIALYRSGRQADALQVYRGGRRLLAGELGLEPGPELQQLEQAILAQDPALDAPSRPPALSTRSQVADTEPGEPPLRVVDPRARRRWALLTVALALAVAGVLAVVLLRGDARPAVEVDAPSVVEIDPATNSVVASIPVGSKPVAIAAGEGGIWVGDARDGTVTKIDPATSRVVRVTGIGAPAVDLATGAGSVWVATGAFGEVVRIDPELGAIADRIPLGNPKDAIVPAVPSIAVGGDRVWAGALTGLVRLDPSSGDVAARVDLGRSAALQIAARHDAVWATMVSSRAKRVEASSAKETAEFYAGNFVFAIASGPDAVWIGGGDGQLWKVDPVTGSEILSARVEGYPTSIAVAPGAVWVAVAGPGALLRIDPRNGEVRQRVEISGSPEDVTVSAGKAGKVWVAVTKLARTGLGQ